MAAIYEDPKALGDAIKKARSPRSQTWLADWAGIDRKRVGRWEKGDVKSLGDTVAKRRAVAAIVAQATGRPDLLGFSEPPAVDIDLLSQDLERLKIAVLQLAEQTLEGDEQADWRKYMPSGRHFEEPAP